MVEALRVAGVLIGLATGLGDLMEVMIGPMEMVAGLMEVAVVGHMEVVAGHMEVGVVVVIPAKKDLEMLHVADQ